MRNKGVYDSETNETKKLLQEVALEQKKNLTIIKEILGSPEFAKFVKEKQGLKPDQDLNQIESLDKILTDKMVSYFAEFLETRSKLFIKEPDNKKMDNSCESSGEQMFAYFDMLTKIGINKISKITTEEYFTLKQFLKDKYLSARDVEMLLTRTNFKAAYTNVNEKIKKLNKLGFIEQTRPTGGGYISNFDGRSQYYKLTSYGLICVVKEIQEIDVGDPFIEVPFTVRIFEVCEDDPLLQLFIYELIDKNLLSGLTDFQIKWPFVKYLKQTCQEIHRELEFFAKFQKDGVGDNFEVKWNRNLVNKKAEWNRFFDNIIWFIIPPHIFDFQQSNLSKLIVNTNITKDSCSFYYDNKKYSIDIETKNKKAKAIFRIDGEEYFRTCDNKKVEEFNKKLDGELAVQIKPHCFILSRQSRESYMYQTLLKRRFYEPIKFLKIQLGYSILQLFQQDKLRKYEQSLAPDSKKYLAELKKLSMDTKVKRLIDEIYREVNENYDGFKVP